jgi:hypothetical protein
VLNGEGIFVLHCCFEVPLKHRCAGFVVFIPFFDRDSPSTSRVSAVAPPLRADSTPFSRDMSRARGRRRRPASSSRPCMRGRHGVACPDTWCPFPHGFTRTLSARAVRFFRLAPNTTTCIAVLPSPRPGLPAAVVITVRVARGQRCPAFLIPALIGVAGVTLRHPRNGRADNGATGGGLSRHFCRALLACA